jgi:DNA-binding response OmpR family regulator
MLPESNDVPSSAVTVCDAPPGLVHTRLMAFDRGVDDNVEIPFSPEEFVARVMVIMRRTYREMVEITPEIRLCDLEIDILNSSARVGGHALHLTSLEVDPLYLRAENAGRVLTRDEILDYPWGVGFITESNVVGRHIRNLRAKLRDDWHRPRYIATVSGKGYRFLAIASDEHPSS